MKKVLVVDDSEMFYNLLKRALTELSVEWSRTGREALGHYTKLKPNLVIVDILLPDIDGVSLIRELKKRDNNARIIALSGIDHSEVVQEAMSAGAIDYITKTAGIDYIRRKIKENIQ